MMFNRRLRRIAFVYVALQVAIWIKCALFFSWFGYGKSMPFSATAFPETAIAFDFFFHNGVHFAIGILALLFGKNIHRAEWAKLAAIVLAAVAIHNAGYWFTAVHPSLAYITVDFARDSIILFCFVAAGHLLGRLWETARSKKQKN